LCLDKKPVCRQLAVELFAVCAYSACTSQWQSNPTRLGVSLQHFVEAFVQTPGFEVTFIGCFIGRWYLRYNAVHVSQCGLRPGCPSHAATLTCWSRRRAASQAIVCNVPTEQPSSVYTAHEAALSSVQQLGLRESHNFVQLLSIHRIQRSHATRVAPVTSKITQKCAKSVILCTPSILLGGPAATMVFSGSA